MRLRGFRICKPEGCSQERRRGRFGQQAKRQALSASAELERETYQPTGSLVRGPVPRRPDVGQQNGAWWASEKRHALRVSGAADLCSSFKAA